MLSLDEQNALREQLRRASPGWRPATELFADAVRERLGTHSLVLDLGCGRGGLVEQLTHPLTQIVGLDPDWHSLREHRLSLPRVAGRSEAPPFAPGRFDLVYASWVLEHLEWPARDLAAIRRLLHPAGTFVFITPNNRHPLVALNRLAGRMGRLQRPLVRRLYARPGADTFPAFYRANSPALLRELAAGAGLNLVSLELVADPTYLAFNPALFALARRLDNRLARERRLHLVGVMTRAL